MDGLVMFVAAAVVMTAFEKGEEGRW